MNKEQTQVSAFLSRVLKVLGPEKTSALSDRQDRMLSQAYRRLLDRKPAAQISEAEIRGQYDLVVDHLSPAAYEVLPQR